jgi:hypothetical protein
VNSKADRVFAERYQLDPILLFAGDVGAQQDTDIECAICDAFFRSGAAAPLQKLECNRGLCGLERFDHSC